jgi:hypothetical protein
MQIFSSFIHYGKINSDNFKQIIDWKPNGVYFAPGNSWLKINKQAALSKNKYGVKLNKNIKLLTIRDTSDVEKIIQYYGVSRNKYNLINWRKISLVYDGLYITKTILQKIHKKDKPWIKKYLFIYMFDVETLCLWNTKKVKFIN